MWGETGRHRDKAKRVWNRADGMLTDVPEGDVL